MFQGGNKRIVMAPITRPWTDDDIAKLRKLAAAGATLMRASAALNRAGTSVQKKARSLGIRFPGVRQVRADLRAHGTLEQPGKGGVKS